ncbi:MAG: PAS domain-containing protein [Thalassobaculaceae bacterium]|nr:PAS domain-containing protein [Thalassobaculaceae bacterium]
MTWRRETSGGRLLDQLSTPACIGFTQAWLEWRGEAVAPHRGQLRLEQIAQHLRWLSVMEVRSPEDMVFRLVGTAINDTRGRELTGTTLKDLSLAKDWPRRAAITWAVASHPAGLTHRVLFEYTLGPPVYSEYVCLPVFSETPGTPVQVFTIREPVEDVSLTLPQLKTAYNHVGEGNRFIDIGAGVPSADLLPEPIESLSI